LIREGHCKQIESGVRKAKANPNATFPKVSSTKIELTPEAKIIADNFKANRGRYLILLKRILFRVMEIKLIHSLTPLQYNSGVEITTDKGAIARAVLVEK
jgi:hypothetical protein